MAIKSREQQAALSLHPVRFLLTGQHTLLVNMMRCQLAEFGIAIPVGLGGALHLTQQITDGEAGIGLPSQAAQVIGMLCELVIKLHARLRELDLRLESLLRSDDMARRPATIPGIGSIDATTVAARSALAGLPRWAIDICGNCWSSGRPP